MQLKIHYKITLIFVFILALIFIGLFINLNKNLKQITFQRIRDRLAKEAAFSQTILEESHFRNFDYKKIDALADKISNDLEVRVTIIDREGVVWGDSDLDNSQLKQVENHLYRPEVQDAISDGFGESRRFSTTIQEDMLYMAYPFSVDDQAGGIVRLSIPLIEIHMLSNSLKRLLAVSFVWTFALFILVSFFASLFISKPINSISRIAMNIAHGDFSQKALVNSKDEIGDLAKAVNEMSEQIRLRIEEITASRTRLEAVFLSMFEGVMIVDAKGLIILVNQSLKDFLGINEDPLGKRPLEVVRNLEIQEVADNVLYLKEGIESRELTVLISDQEKTLLIHGAPIQRKGHNEGAVLVFHDITEIRCLEKIRQDFVANVSHELRTPVTNIKGYAETLIEGALRDKKNAESFLKIIYRESSRLANLISDLLDLTQIETGKLKLSLSECSLYPIVERVLAGLSIKMKEKNLTVKNEITQDLPKVKVDVVSVTQVFLNLIENAIKYNQENGEIIITAKESNGQVKIFIKDTGIGIPEKDIPRIFERFYRVDKARSREMGGTGLGLSIVKHIIQAHHGEIFVNSELTKGSEFSFTLYKA